MEKEVMKRLDLSDFKYLSPKELSPYLGVQAHADAYCGMCNNINDVFTFKNIKSDISQKKLVKFLIKRDKKLRSMILKYAKHVENTLKYNEDYVLELFDEVIEELDLL